MKNAHYFLRLDNPCTQNWEDMTPDIRGRFCASCQKTVVDFSEMTDNEVISFIQENAGGFCGQFRGDQLNRKFTETKFAPRNFRVNTLLSGLTFAGLAGTASAQTASTSKPKEVVIDTTHWSGPVCLRSIEKDTSDLVLNVTLMDSIANEPIPYGSVFVNGHAHFSGQTDFDGKITLRIPADSLTDSISIEVRVVGFRKKTIDISTASRNQDITVNMGLSEMMMLGGAVTSIAYTDKPNPIQRIRHFFSRIRHGRDMEY